MSGRRFSFTQAAIDEIVPPPEGRDVYYDTSYPGLGLRVIAPSRKSPAGRKVFFWLGKHAGRTVRETLGTYPKLKPAPARTLAKRTAERVATGVRPTEERRAEREEAKSEPVLENWTDR